MRFVPRLIACCALFLFGCSFAHDAAVGSYHVATSPVRLFHHPSPTPAPSMTAVAATSAPEMRASVPPRPSPDAASSSHRSTHYVKGNTSSPSPAPAKQTAEQTPPKTKPIGPVQTAPAPATFPTAKAVPDKPGYVYSVAEPNKYVDVSGYPPGSKVKDPYSGQIFTVP